MPPLPLPVEILDYIFNFLADEPKTLADLALVSRSFVQSSRALYPESINITPENLETLLLLLKSPHRTISRNIRKIDIQGPWDDHSSNILLTTNWQLPLDSFGNTVLSLSLFAIDFDSLSSMAYQTFLAGFPRVQFLKLHSMKFISVSQVMNTLGQFPALRAASLCNIAWNNPDNDTPETIFPYRIPSGLYKLTLKECYKRDIMRCFLSQESLPLIKELDLGAVSPSDTEAIGEYLGRLGPVLSSLSFGFDSLDPGGDAEDFYHNCNLALNTSLKSLHYDPFVDFFVSSLTNPWPWISRTISTLHSNALTQICFSIHLITSRPLIDCVQFTWSEMDRFFANKLPTTTLPRCTSLQLWIHFDDVLSPDLVQMIREFMTEQFPLCHENGLLTIRFVT
ncbi:hypothetical protein BDP27DRAFT_1426048 [Rhodocollybia butyracea]|uniref:F-box domain-containing protein n=1 Tax=Rhodocollybia butyracea TaxID=206335 RepID=A0A9P5U372_9AGAR|nr:hypothetical protein BDP27DRAFT_1426048 [Rhodocollybia butyracea]